MNDGLLISEKCLAPEQKTAASLLANNAATVAMCYRQNAVCGEATTTCLALLSRRRLLLLVTETAFRCSSAKDGLGPTHPEISH